MDCQLIDRTTRRYLAGHTLVADPALDLDDLMQTAWLRALPHLPAIPTDQERAHYLIRVVKRLNIDVWRKQHRRARAPLDANLASNEDVESLVLTSLAAERAIKVAPEAAVLLGLGWSLGEVAARSGKHPVTVKTALWRWRQRHRDTEAA